ncbi:MAG: membrane protein insertase YidC [Clostridia bacterium]|nr:membrane protein insertase YidC [Clostridia bacterium]
MNSSFFLVRWLFVAMDWVYQQMCTLFSTGGWVVVLTIFLFTLAIKLLTIFSDIRSRKSSMQMQAIQPEIDKLKKKYGNDQQRFVTEQRKLMKERGVSTMGGCLPMLIMMPLLFMFFAAFRAWSNQQTLDLMLKIDAGQGAEAFAASRFLWITNIWRPDSLDSPNFQLLSLFSCAGGSGSGGVIMNGQTFWNTFTTSNNIKDFIFFSKNEEALTRILYELHFFTKTIAEDGTVQYVFAQDGGKAFMEAYKAFVEPITSNTALIGGDYANMSNGYAILPVLAALTTFLSSWLTQRQQKAMQNTPAKSDDKNDPAAQTQSMNKMMMIMMPFMSLFFCYQYDSTFAFYWIFSNVISLAITLILNATVFKKMQQQMQQGTVEVKKK